MKKLILAGLCAAGLAVAVCGPLSADGTGDDTPAQPVPAPQPGPEALRMAVWHGEWTYTGEILSTAAGPGAKYNGTLSVRPVQNGFAAEFLYVENGPEGTARYRQIVFWDPASKTYIATLVGDNGYCERGSVRMEGRTVTGEFTITIGDRAHALRSHETIAEDGNSFSYRCEICAGGGEWVPYSEARFVRVAGRGEKDKRD